MSSESKEDYTKLNLTNMETVWDALHDHDLRIQQFQKAIPVNLTDRLTKLEQFVQNLSEENETLKQNIQLQAETLMTVADIRCIQFGTEQVREAAIQRQQQALQQIINEAARERQGLSHREPQEEDGIPGPRKRKTPPIKTEEPAESQINTPTESATRAPDKKRKHNKGLQDNRRSRSHSPKPAFRPILPKPQYMEPYHQPSQQLFPVYSYQQPCQQLSVGYQQPYQQPTQLVAGYPQPYQQPFVAYQYPNPYGFQPPQQLPHSHNKSPPTGPHPWTPENRNAS